MNPNEHATPPREQLIRLRFEEKMNREQLADYYDVSVATVRRWIKELGIPRPGQGGSQKRKRKPQKTEVKIDDGYTLIERARIQLGGRLVVRNGYGYYLDGKPASVDDIARALE